MLKSWIIGGMAVVLLGANASAAVLLGLPEIDAKPAAPAGAAEPDFNAGSKDKNVNALMWNAQDAYRDGNISEALRLILQAKRKAPFNLEIAAATAKVLVNMGRFEEAIDELFVLLEKKPRDGDTLRLAGYCLERLARYDEALDIYTKLGIANPGDVNPYYYRGAVYFKLGDSDQAIEEYENALKLDPENPRYLEAAGAVWMKVERYDEAINYFKKAIRIDPEFADAYNSLGTALFKSGSRQEGIAYVRRAVRIKEDYAQAYGNMASMLALMDRQDEALTWLAKSLQYDIFLPITWQNAMVALDRVFSEVKSSDIPESPSNLSGAYLAQWAFVGATKMKEAENSGAAVRYLIRAIQSDSSDPKYFAELGRLLMDTEFSVFGLKCIELASMLDYENEELRAEVNSYYQQKSALENEAVKEDFEKRLTINPENAALQYQYANLLDMRGEITNAINHYALAVQYQPTSIVARLSLSGAYYRVGDFEPALESLVSCFDIDPESLKAWWRLLSVIRTALPAEELAEPLPQPSEKLNESELAQWHFDQSEVAELRGEMGWVLTMRHIEQSILLLNTVPQRFKRFGDHVAKYFSPRLAVPFYQMATIISEEPDTELEAALEAGRAAADFERLTAGLNRARLFHQQGQSPMALRILDDLVNRYPEKPDILYQKAWLMIYALPVDAVKVRDAIELLSTVEKLSGSEIPAIVYRAKAQGHHLLGQHADATREAVAGVKAAQGEKNDALAKEILAEAVKYRAAAKEQ